MNLFKLSGLLSILFGTISCLILIKPFLLMISLLSAIIGFTFATINVYLNAKFEITKGSFSIGYIGMILSSFPVIFLMVLIIRG
jgi:hypothetical protein